ncbi:hypothetical protein EYF80_005264 [Liparis tanakae]|uniref:Uncharacterized protein n=1 Tax=Liparis tanakae TaxID=230148 RepID=A0A4Z2J3V6_9TELE|nr:hypothetical protein EYF80_005264 [Liparis tanakae]
MEVSMYLWTGAGVEKGFRMIFSASKVPMRALGLSLVLFLLVVTSSRVWLDGLRWYSARDIGICTVEHLRAM